MACLTVPWSAYGRTPHCIFPKCAKMSVIGFGNVSRSSCHNSLQRRTAMRAAKIMIGVMLVLMAAIVRGDSLPGQACFKIPPDAPNWKQYAPGTGCMVWTGCSTANHNGLCAGITSMEIDTISGSYYVLSCKSGATGAIHTCNVFPDTRCKAVSRGWCLTVTVYSNADCTGASAKKYVSAYRCDTDFSG
jgi:hypothetical protein